MRNYKHVFDALFREVNKIVVGQNHVVEQILAAVLCGGNALLEGYPGLAKTLAVRTLADVMDLKFSRIQNLYHRRDFGKEKFQVPARAHLCEHCFSG